MRHSRIAGPTTRLTVAPHLVADLVPHEHRAARADELARALGAEQLVIFVPDADVGALLPALGFPQTLRNGRAWREFTSGAVSAPAQARLPFGEVAADRDVAGFPLSGGAVAVLVGGRPDGDAVEDTLPALALLAFGLTRERDAVAGRGHAQAAHLAAQQAQDLAQSLAAAQGELHVVVQELQEASRMKDEFLANISHELRTPLNAITGWAYMLRKEAAVDETTRQRGLEAIVRNARSQAQLISDLLDVSRIVAGKMRLDVRPVEVGAVIEAALDTIRPAAGAKEIELEAVVDPLAGPVAGDPDRLQQVVWNLLSNAVRFAPRRGRVQVRLARVESHVEVTVEDNGPGVDPAFLPFVFDRFRQGGAAEKRKHGGLGLGLAIVRHLTELHGGSVQARNVDTGTGAVFQVRLPRLSVDAAGAARHPTADVAGGGEALPSLAGLKVLLVEDDADSREMAAAVLTRVGATVITAASAQEALTALQRDRPDVLVSDVGLPGEDGFELLRRVRALPAERGGLTPAAALTAYASARDRMLSLRSGFQIHLPKPVQPAELVTVVASLVRRT